MQLHRFFGLIMVGVMLTRYSSNDVYNTSECNFDGDFCICENTGTWFLNDVI